MGEQDFDAAEYWETRLKAHWGLSAVGFLGMGDAYNSALYRVKARVLRRAARRLPIDLAQARVLDVGSGVGFVVQQWQALGVRHLVGSDISPFAVAQLRAQYPSYRFVEADIGSPAAADNLRESRFDCISALDVLYHIVDDDAYQRALKNISSLLRPGGYFLLADNFVRSGTVRGRHQVSHSLQSLQEWLRDAHLEIAYRTPQFVLMNFPIDSNSRWLHLWWQKVSSQVKRSERRALWLGHALVPVEMVLTKMLREGPSTELAVCRKAS